jgi:hypothetical protein
MMVEVIGAKPGKRPFERRRLKRVFLDSREVLGADLLLQRLF